MPKEKSFSLFAWLLSVAVTFIAIFAWGQGLNWQFSNINSYTLFPLFGLLAFSLMWAHYIVAAGKKFHGLDKNLTNQYFEITSLVVLGAIILHPTILIWQLWRDGMGLPPGSVYAYVGPALKLAVTLGVLSWLIFMAYEFRRKFRKKSWWKYVQYSSDVAMFLIFVHSLSLGSNLQSGWFRYLWLAYGITYGVVLIYLYGYKKSNNKKVTP